MDISLFGWLIDIYVFLDKCLQPFNSLPWQLVNVLIFPTECILVTWVKMVVKIGKHGKQWIINLKENITESIDHTFLETKFTYSDVLCAFTPP